MINKKEFDLLLQEIFRIENKIVEIKVLKQFEKSSEFETELEKIRLQAKDIVLDNTNSSSGFDKLSLDVISKLIILDSNIDYFILKTNNIIESTNESKIDAEALKQVKRLWDSLEMDLKIWNKSQHNPIEEIEYNKHIGKITLENIIFQLQTEGVLDFTRVFKYCKKELLINAIEKVLFEGAKNEFHDEIRKNRLIELAKKVSEQDLYDYKLWQQILMIKNVRSRDDHIEIMGNLQDKRKYVIDEDDRKPEKIIQNRSDEETGIDLYENETIFTTMKTWFSGIAEFFNQKNMEANWGTNEGPAFRIEFDDGSHKFASKNLDAESVKHVKKLLIATNGVAKYNFDKESKFENLEEIIFSELKNTAGVNLSPDKTYNCIGNDCFADSDKLKNISFGKIEVIGERAFKNCNSLTSLTFSSNLKNINEDAFLDCKNLTKVEFLGSLQLYILERPQNILNCFKGTNLEEIIFANIESAFNFAITNCPNLKKIYVSDIPDMELPFKVCKYRLGREEGIVHFIGENSLRLWKKRNTTIRFFELTDDDIEKYNLK